MNIVRLQAYSGRGCAPGICIDSHMLTVGGQPVGPHYHNGFTLRNGGRDLPPRHRSDGCSPPTETGAGGEWHRVAGVDAVVRGRPVPEHKREGRTVWREVVGNIRDIRRANGRVISVWLGDEDFEAMRRAFHPQATDALGWGGPGGRIGIFRASAFGMSL